MTRFWLPGCYSSPVPALRKRIQEFSYQEIKVATDNFRVTLGQGGFGDVYQGKLKDGRVVAVKVASKKSYQGSKAFLNEVDLLSRIHHRNLVGLLGYCRKEKLVLVYEFMSNGALDILLHGPNAAVSPLSWRARLSILVDAAQGIDYLHQGCHPRIIHRDVKSSNILLSEELEAKISDFGISRNSRVTGTGAPTTALMGTRGYVDPDYLVSMSLTENVDVYSFGVVLFEVVSGKKAIFVDSSTHEPIHIVEWARPLVSRGRIHDIADPSLHKNYNFASMGKVLEIALKCVATRNTSEYTQRPTMGAVINDLKEAEQIELSRNNRNVRGHVHTL